MPAQVYIVVHASDGEPGRWAYTIKVANDPDGAIADEADGFASRAKARDAAEGSASYWGWRVVPGPRSSATTPP
jgi:hypothetical protein